MVTWSVTSVLVPSETLSTKVTVASESTVGAVKVVNGEVASDMVMGSAESWLHKYVRWSPSGSEAVPLRVTCTPSLTATCSPASTEGGLLACAASTLISTFLELPWPKLPVDVTVTS